MAGDLPNPKQPPAPAPAAAPAAAPDKAPAKAKPKVKTFTCPSCGGSVEIRTFGLAITVVCPYCSSVIDATNQDFQLLCKFYGKTTYKPRFELGSRGKLKGRLWEVIGFCVRRDVISGFQWEEYLLFNPYYGYRWLAESNGHWNFVRTIKDKPTIAGDSNRIELGNQIYRVYYRGQADMVYVLGEFYWQVAVDSRVDMEDYIAPPQMLSMERDGTEIIWSLSEYIEARALEKAFKLKEKLPPRKGVAPNQPSGALTTWKRVGVMWAVFGVVLTTAQFSLASMASNTTCFMQAFNFVTNAKSTDTITTPVFEVPKQKANLAIQFDGNTDNSWVWISGELVNNDTGDTVPFERTISYYHGYDDGEAWSEGGNSSRLHLSALPGGHYYINMDTESGDWKTTGDPQQFILTVKRDVPTFANYFWCLFWISILPGLCFLHMRQFEVARWFDSDYSPYQSESS